MYIYTYIHTYIHIYVHQNHNNNNNNKVRSLITAAAAGRPRDAASAGTNSQKYLYKRDL